MDTFRNVYLRIPAINLNSAKAQGTSAFTYDSNTFLNIIESKLHNLIQLVKKGRTPTSIL